MFFQSGNNQALKHTTFIKLDVFQMKIKVFPIFELKGKPRKGQQEVLPQNLRIHFAIVHKGNLFFLLAISINHQRR